MTDLANCKVRRGPGASRPRARRSRARRGLLQLLLPLFALLSSGGLVHAEEPPEYRLKAAFVYNFALFTEWPADVGGALHLCVFGADPFGKDIDALQGKPVGARSIVVWRKTGVDSLDGCQILFIAAPAMDQLGRVLDCLRGSPTLTVADSPGATGRGVALNMSVALNKVTFEANLPAARNAGLNLSSKLLRLATQVIQ